MELSNLSKLLWISLVMVAVSCSDLLNRTGTSLIEADLIEEGLYSNYSEEGLQTLVIESQGHFANEWDKLHKGKEPIPELPDIDFSDKTIIMVIMESKPTGGYNIDSVEIGVVNNRIEVRFRELQPGENCITTQAITRPFKVFSIDRTGKKVIFTEEEAVIRDCN
ncbi:MAG: protease complex subunit PrcB family protein [Gracilimonas sp.]|nr:protease complex subunit PrcB family protein [Gracilimonas sp.]